MMKTNMTMTEAYDKVHAIMSRAKNGEYAARRVEKIMAEFVAAEFVAQWGAIARRRAAENVAYDKQVRVLARAESKTICVRVMEG